MTAPSPSRDTARLAPAQDVEPEPEPSSGARPIVATLAQRYLEARRARARADEELEAIGAELMKAMTLAHVERVEPLEGVRVAMVRAGPRVTLDRPLCELTIRQLRDALDAAEQLLRAHGIRYEAPTLPARLTFKSCAAPAPFLVVRLVPGDSAPTTRKATTNEL